MIQYVLLIILLAISPLLIGGALDHYKIVVGTEREVLIALSGMFSGMILIIGFWWCDIKLKAIETT